MARMGQLMNLARYVWNHSDDLVRLFESLPPALRAAGAGLESAGDGAVLAGRTLGGDSALPVNAAEVLQGAAGAVEQSHEQIRAVAHQIRAVADALDQIRVPAVSPVKKHFNLSMLGLGEHDLITGLTVSQHTPGAIAGVSERMRAQAGLVESNFGGQLHTAAERLAEMSRTLDGAGNGLKSLGDSLKQGGASLHQLGS